jgi:Domain of unknown function (DUF4440)
MINHSRNAAPFATLADYIRALEAARIQALLTRDMELLWQLHAPDYQLITPTGRSYTRDRYLSEIEAEALRYLRWEPGSMNVRTSRQMAIVRYRATLELDGGDGHGTPFHCWHTDSYELKDESWQAVWSQATTIR